MKTILVFLIIFISSNIQATDLLSFSKNAGFSPFPYSSLIMIRDNGEIVKSIKTREEETSKILGILSAETVLSLKNKIANIDDDAQLIDPGPEVPYCTDAPFSSVVINKGKNDIVIEADHSCHHLKIASFYVDDLVRLIKGLDSL